MDGLKINNERVFISEFETDKENPTKWKIGILDPDISADIEDNITDIEVSSKKGNDKAKAKLNIGRRNLLILRYGLKGFENFMDPETGKEIKFETEIRPFAKKSYEVVSDRIIALIPSKVRTELANAILDENTFSEEEEKN